MATWLTTMLQRTGSGQGSPVSSPVAAAPPSPAQALIDAAERDPVETVQRLVNVDGGVSVHVRGRYRGDREHGTPLLAALAAGRAPTAHFLIDAGSDATAVDANRTTTLHFAAEKDCLPLLQRLVEEKGADVNGADATGVTPLHVAALNGRTHIVAYLLTHGADMHARSADGRNACECARAIGATTAVALLEAAMAAATPLRSKSSNASMAVSPSITAPVASARSGSDGGGFADLEVTALAAGMQALSARVVDLNTRLEAAQRSHEAEMAAMREKLRTLTAQVQALIATGGAPLPPPVALYDDAGEGQATTLDSYRTTPPPPPPLPPPVPLMMPTPVHAHTPLAALLTERV